ncbi:IS110 family transposase [Modestobacter sp. VKM Ac-2977]|uniref:IS110 family transposase n=1 Tax=Modestobacter sp. VKM Ac-2977 TaxID=3004131 RepID=UPI0022AA808B|nr:IS110 family transposase [Modestobacter sp. VKM Ac-2977]MCZ2819737.1 IS110 family transposase [Modestobacter sp. VKM Ac-2977]
MSRLAERHVRDHLERPEWPPGAVIGGVDTHKHIHVAAVCDPLGRVLASDTFPTTTAGFKALLRFLRSHGELAAVGIEGTGCWGGGLARWLAARDVHVVEVDRPNRQARRRRGKSDTIDAEEAARAVVAGRARTVPKTGTGPVEMARQLRVARRSAIKQRTQALLQLQALADTAPDELRDTVKKLRYAQLIATAARFRPGELTTTSAAAKYAMSALARRIQHLDAEIEGLDTHLKAILTAAHPDLLAAHGVGPDTAGALLVAAGDNPERLVSEQAFAALCGASPVQASSGNTHRHRLNRGGDRQANSALWRIVLVRMKTHPPTRDYVTRRTAEGLAKRDIMRCLKRYVAREIYHHISPTPPAAATLRLVPPLPSADPEQAAADSA